jgi:protein-L-isoaspartate(D-aspartate) O-methyltransferase
MTTIEKTEFTSLRHSMVELIEVYTHLSSERIDKDRLDRRVMAAMARVPRHEFVPEELQHVAYMDSPLPIGCGKTISQPFMVALMSDLLEVEEHHRVLEIGTGLGYQAAILAELADEVFSVEILDELATEGEERVRALGYGNVRFRVGDGSQGWADEAPFDRIMVTAAPELMPPALLQQLGPGGRMIIPAGLPEAQQLLLVEKDQGGRTATREILPVVFSRLITSH